MIPKTGDRDLTRGIPRNYEIFDPLDFLAEVTQHIPDKGAHQIHYYGWYSNKMRAMQRPLKATATEPSDPDTPFRRKCRLTWAALIKAIYEVDPLTCPKCGGKMKIVSFITEAAVVQKILRHCRLWKEPLPIPIRPPPPGTPPPFREPEPVLDYSFFQSTCV